MQNKIIKNNKHKKTKKFFETSMNWYISKYLVCYKELSYILIITILTSIPTFMSIYIVVSLLHVTKNYPVIYYTENQIDYITKIYPIQLKGENVNDAIAKYLIKVYIKNREECAFSNKYSIPINKKTWNQRILFLKKNSSNKEFNTFKKTLNPIKYTRIEEENKIINIKIKSIKTKKYDNNIIKAITEFIIETNKAFTFKNKHSIQCKTEMIFSLTKIETIIAKNITLKFLVTSYNSNYNYKTNI